MMGWALFILAGIILVMACVFIWVTLRLREDEIEILSRNSERPAPIERDK